MDHSLNGFSSLTLFCPIYSIDISKLLHLPTWNWTLVGSSRQLVVNLSRVCETPILPFLLVTILLTLDKITSFSSAPILLIYTYLYLHRYVYVYLHNIHICIYNLCRTFRSLSGMIWEAPEEHYIKPLSLSQTVQTKHRCLFGFIHQDRFAKILQLPIEIGMLHQGGQHG